MNMNHHEFVQGYFSTNCYAFLIDKQLVIIDPTDNPELLIRQIDTEYLASENLKPEKAHILCTHGHWDHIGGIPQLKKYLNQKNIDSLVYIHQDDSNYLGKEGKARHLELFKFLGIQNESIFESFYQELSSADIIISDGEKLIDDMIRVIHTPGHTPGGVCYYIPEYNTLYGGDTIFSGTYGRTDLPGGSSAMLLESIQSKLLVLPENTVIFSGHGNETTILNEKKNYLYN